jgi:hypothetical protein
MLQPRVIAGETSQALLQVEFQPEETKSVEINDTIRSMALKDRLRSFISHFLTALLSDMKLFYQYSAKISPRIVLSDTLDIPGFKILMENGLSTRCGNVSQEWSKQRKLDEANLNKDRAADRVKRKDDIKKTVEYLKLRMPFALVRKAIQFFP